MHWLKNLEGSYPLVGLHWKVIKKNKAKSYLVKSGKFVCCLSILCKLIGRTISNITLFYNTKCKQLIPKLVFLLDGPLKIHSLLAIVHNWTWLQKKCEPMFVLCMHTDHTIHHHKIQVTFGSAKLCIKKPSVRNKK